MVYEALFMQSRLVLGFLDSKNLVALMAYNTLLF